MIDREWKPNLTVAALIERAGRFLMVEEHTPEGLRLNQPAGHLEPGESLLEASVRETLEEAAHRFVPEYLVGIYQWTWAHSGITYLRFAYGGRSTGEELGRALDEGIVRTLWMDVDALRASVERHRSPLVLQCVEDWLAGQRYPLALVHHS